MQGPSFMKNILNFDIQSNGVISGLPFLCSYLSSVLFCYAADALLKHNILSLTNVRKLMTASSQIIPGLLVVLVGYVEDELVLTLVIWSIAVTMITASYAGAMANIVDISPNFAGPVLAFAQTIHMSASFLSPMINGVILTDQKNLMQWRTCFILSSIVAVLTYIMYQFHGTAEVQPWNYYDTKSKTNETQHLEEGETDAPEKFDEIENGKKLSG